MKKERVILPQSIVGRLKHRNDMVEGPTVKESFTKGQEAKNKEKNQIRRYTLPVYSPSDWTLPNRPHLLMAHKAYSAYLVAGETGKLKILY